MVRLYGFEKCPYCKELRGLLESNNVKYDYVDVTLSDNEKESNRIFEIAGEETVPIVLVDKTVLVPDKSFKTIQEAYELTKKFLND
jgi:glutaredoxin